VVTYEQIFEAFCKYAASREQGAWCDLWILTQRRMEALVKYRAKGLTVPLEEQDLQDLITDSAAGVIEKLVTAHDVNADYISAQFHYCNKTAFEIFNRATKKQQKIAEIISNINDRYARFFQEEPESSHSYL